MISKAQYKNISFDLKCKSRALAIRLYAKGVPSHIIAQAFREANIHISTKTILQVVRLFTSGSGIRGYDPYHRKQTYHWAKYFGRGRNWRIIGKITPRLRGIMNSFCEWWAYSRIYGFFDLEAVLRGEKPP